MTAAAAVRLMAKKGRKACAAFIFDAGVVLFCLVMLLCVQLQTRAVDQIKCLLQGPYYIVF